MAELKYCSNYLEKPLKIWIMILTLTTKPDVLIIKQNHTDLESRASQGQDSMY